MTLGDHLRRRRMDLGLRQWDVAKRIGVDTSTVTNWELGRTEPEGQSIPGILDFLGTDPRPLGEGFPERLRRAREALGLTQRQLATRLGVDPSTVWSWERGRSARPPRNLARWVRIAVSEGGDPQSGPFS